MMAISTGGIGRVNVQDTRTGKASKSDEKTEEGFAGIFNLTSAKLDNTYIDMSLDRSDTAVASCTKDNVSKSCDRTGYKDSSYTGKYDKTSDISASERDGAGDDISDSVDELCNDIRKALRDVLGVDDDDIDRVLSDMGIGMGNLTDADALKNFMLTICDKTGVELITDEKLSGLLEELCAAVDDILKQYDTESLSASELTGMLNEINPEVSSGEDGQEKSNHINSDNMADTAGISGNEVTEIKGSVDIISDGDGSDSPSSHTGSFGGNTSMDYSADGRGVQVLENLNQAIDASLSADDVTDVSYETSIMRQLIDSIRVNISRESTSMTVLLNPESLGRVQVSVANRNGVMQAQIVAETEAAKNAIENNLALLREAFDTNELKVDAVEVMVASQDYFDGQRDNGEDDSRNEKQTEKAAGLNTLAASDEESLDDDSDEALLRAKGSSVSYSV